MRSRKKPSMGTLLASALLTIQRVNERGQLEPVIPYEKAKTMTAVEIRAAFDFDHGVHHALGGSDHPSNLTPRPRAEHRTKTNKVDIPAIAKTKRRTRAQEEFTARMLAKEPGQPRERTSRIPSRPFPKRSKSQGART